MTDIPWTWFVMRASGVVAVGLLTLAVALGLIGPRLRPTARLVAISTHRVASTAGSLLIVLHVVLALTDRWITLDWPAALLPGVAGWQRWGVALGALAVDLMLALLLTTATRYRAPRLWRRTHLVAYPVWVLAVGHGLLVGTDGQLMAVLAVVSGAVFLAALAMRLILPTRAPAAHAGAPLTDVLVGSAR